jgi:hypothetical protein
MENKSKLETISEILTAAELDEEGYCGSCDEHGNWCECFAGFVRAKMQDNENAKFFPDDQTCLEMTAQHFNLDDVAKTSLNDYIAHLCDWPDQDDDCDHPERHENDAIVETDKKGLN